MVQNMPEDHLLRSTLLLKKWDPREAMMFQEVYRSQSTTASEWFSKKFPRQAQTYGCPFLELNQEYGVNSKVSPLSMNVDFFAAILGGDERLGHRVIYFEPDMQFYYYDPRTQVFKPTSEEKLRNLLRAYLVRCAEELPGSVHKLALFHEFRSDRSVKSVVHRAKSILAADYTFFGSQTSNIREKGPEMPDRVARSFVERLLEHQPGQVLPLANAHLLFNELMEKRELEPVNRNDFKTLATPLIRERFELGLRNDLPGPFDKLVSGWKDLKALQVGVLSRN